MRDAGFSTLERCRRHMGYWVCGSGIGCSSWNWDVIWHHYGGSYDGGVCENFYATCMTLLPGLIQSAINFEEIPLNADWFATMQDAG